MRQGVVIFLRISLNSRTCIRRSVSLKKSVSLCRNSKSEHQGRYNYVLCPLEFHYRFILNFSSFFLREECVQRTAGSPCSSIFIIEYYYALPLKNIFVQKRSELATCPSYVVRPVYSKLPSTRVFPEPFDTVRNNQRKVSNERVNVIRLVLIQRIIFKRRHDCRVRIQNDGSERRPGDTDIRAHSKLAFHLLKRSTGAAGA